MFTKSGLNCITRLLHTDNLGYFWIIDSYSFPDAIHGSDFAIFKYNCVASISQVVLSSLNHISRWKGKIKSASGKKQTRLSTLNCHCKNDKKPKSFIHVASILDKNKTQNEKITAWSMSGSLSIHVSVFHEHRMSRLHSFFNMFG